MPKPDSINFDTLALHAGQHPDPQYGARAVPIYQTTSYVFPDSDYAASLFNLERAGHIYSRISNPTVAVLEERLAALEGGVGAVCTASGQAALHLAIATLMSAGSHIVASKNVYGGSYNLFCHTLPRFGIETTFVDARDIQGFKDSIRENTRLIFGETIGNPGLEVLDIPTLASVAHSANLPLMIDNTFATPYLCQPISYGANLIMHSVTKFLGGHGVAIGGALIDGGNFEWDTTDKFPNMTNPYEGYHGLKFSEEFGPAAFIMRARAEGLRDFGASMSPSNAFYILLGVEDVHTRMRHHIENTRKIVSFLDGHDAVSWVTYPELKGHKDFELSKKLLPKGAGSVPSFGIKGGRQAGKTFIEQLYIFSHLANVGDAKSLVIHPASTTHQQMSIEELKASGVGEDLVRLSIGLEDADDLMNDLDQALKASQKT